MNDLLLHVEMSKLSNVFDFMISSLIFDEKPAIKDDYEWFLYFMLKCWQGYVEYPWSRNFSCNRKVPKFFLRRFYVAFN